MEIWIGTTEEIFTKIGREKDKLFAISSFRTELHGLRVKHNVNRTLTTINLDVQRDHSSAAFETIDRLLNERRTNFLLSVFERK